MTAVQGILLALSIIVFIYLWVCDVQARVVLEEAEAGSEWASSSPSSLS